jgi:hypothetical protein
MYSTAIIPKVEKMFGELRAKVSEIAAETNSANEAVNKIVQLVSSETAIRSKTILSDMLFDLSDSLLKTAFFSDITKQNKFFELNLRQEILNKYQFTSNSAIDYKEAAQMVQALKVGGGTFVIGGIGAIGTVLIKGRSLSSLVPVPVSVLVIAALGAALVDYLAIEPNRSKKNFTQAAENYLTAVQQQFLNWFDEVENYFNKRVDEIKQTI